MMVSPYVLIARHFVPRLAQPEYQWTGLELTSTLAGVADEWIGQESTAQAALLLEAAGILKVANLADGMIRWRAPRLPVQLAA